MISFTNDTLVIMRYNNEYCRNLLSANIFLFLVKYMNNVQVILGVVSIEDIVKSDSRPFLLSSRIEFLTKLLFIYGDFISVAYMWLKAENMEYLVRIKVTIQ